MKLTNRVTRSAAGWIIIGLALFGAPPTAHADDSARGTVEIWPCTSIAAYRDKPFAVEGDAERVPYHLCYHATGLGGVQVTLRYHVWKRTPDAEGMDIGDGLDHARFTPASDDEYGPFAVAMIEPDVVPEADSWDYMLEFTDLWTTPSNRAQMAPGGWDNRYLHLYDNDPIASVRSIGVPEFDGTPSTMPVSVTLDKAPRNKTVCVTAKTGIANNGGREASPGPDYSPFPSEGVRRCASGRSTTIPFNVVVQPDQLPEGSEAFAVTIGDASNVQIDPRRGRSFVTIVDDDD